MSYDYDVTWFLEGLLFIITFAALVLCGAQAYSVLISSKTSIFVSLGRAVYQLIPALILLVLSIVTYIKESR